MPNAPKRVAPPSGDEWEPMDAAVPKQVAAPQGDEWEAVGASSPKPSAIPGTEKLGGLPPMPKAPVPFALRSDEEQRRTATQWRNPRTGATSPMLPPGKEGGPLGFLDMPHTGGERVYRGVQQMTRPGFAAKAGGTSEVLRGGMEAAAPFVTPFAAATPVASAVALGVGTAAQQGTEAGLNLAGAPPEVSALAGDIAGITAGGKTYKKAAGADVVKAAQNKLFGKEDPNMLISKAVKQPSGKTWFKENLDLSLPEIKQAEAQLGRPIQSLDDLIGTPDKPGAIRLAKQANRDQYRKLQGPQHEMGSTVDMTPVANAMERTITPKMRLEEPGKVDAILARASLYRRRVPIEEAESILRSTNAELDAYYGKNPAARRVATDANPETALLDAQARAARDVIYKTLDAPGQGAAARELQRRYGALMELERIAYQRRPVAMRQQPDSLSEQFSKWHAAGQLAKAGLRLFRGDFAGAAMDTATAIAERKAAQWVKEQGTTDKMIERAFRNYNRTPAPIDMPPPFQPKALLESGPIRMPGVADPSGIKVTPGMPYAPDPRKALPAPSPFKMPPVPDTSGPVPTPPPMPGRGMGLPTGARTLPPPSRVQTGGFAVQDVVPIRNPRTGQIEYVPEWTLQNAQPAPGSRLFSK